MASSVQAFVDSAMVKHLAGVHRFLVLTIFNEGAYLTFQSNFHKALNLF